MSEKVNLFIEIGNSDDKLTQREWSRFIAAVDSVIDSYSTRVFGRWFSSPESIYQNACFHFEVSGRVFNAMEEKLGVIAKRFNQSSIALTQGDTVFVTKEGKEVPEPPVD